MVEHHITRKKEYSIGHVQLYCNGGKLGTVSQLMGGDFLEFCLHHIFEQPLTSEILKIKNRPGSRVTGVKGFFFKRVMGIYARKKCQP